MFVNVLVFGSLLYVYARIESLYAFMHRTEMH